MRKSITHQGEIAFAAYGKGNSAGTVLEPCNFYAAHIVTPNPLDTLGNPSGFANLTPPLVVFTASRPRQIAFDSPIYELVLTGRLETQIDDDSAIPGTDIHGDRIEALRDLLEDFNKVYAWINPTNTARGFSSFTFSALAKIDDGERLMQEDRRQIIEIDYYLCAAPVD